MQAIIDHYNEVREDLRLTQGWGSLELARTQEIMLRHLMKAPATVLDIGGAAGIYSAWLGSLGYETHLIDLMPHHVEQAHQRPDVIRTAQVGDARRLPFDDHSADAVLLMGPLYHLTKRDQRLDSLREARRVLRPGGLLFGAAISRFASLFDSIVRGFNDDPRFVAILDQDLIDGQHRNPTGDPNFFTTAFFHHPEELRAELAEARFSIIELVGVEGPAWLAHDFELRWNDPARRERLLDLNRKVEREPALLGLSPHLLIVGRK